MYDHLYEVFAPGEVEVVVHADHPTLNRRVAEMLAAGERIDVLATHSKYAPSQADWLQPLDELLAPAAVGALASGAVELCRFRNALLCVPRLIDVRVMWVRTDRVDVVPDTWDALAESDVVFGFPGRESGLFGTFFELVTGQGGNLFAADGHPTMASAEAEWAVATLVRLAARAPSDLPTWHYDELDRALLDGRLDAAGAWPGGWSAIRRSESAAQLRPFLYPAGKARRAVYAGCHAWAIPTTCGDLDAARALITRLVARDVQAHDARGGNICAHVGALAAIEPVDDVDRVRLDITRETIATAMITFPPLTRFGEIEEAGWTAINAAIRGVETPADAIHAIQSAAVAVLARQPGAV
jgi:multiple sugar transport system substrate-binding protein